MIGGSDGRGDWGACDPTEPRNRRTRASIVVDGGEGALLVDTAPDLRAQLLACAIGRVDAVLFTHAHADHITGLDDVRILNRILDRPMPMFANQTTLADLQRRFDYAFRPWTGPGFFRPVLAPTVVVPGETVRLLGMAVRIFDQDHGFSHTLGLRIGGFGYSTDVVNLDEAAFAALDGIDTWLVGCFLRKGPHKTHADLTQVLAWRDRIQPRRTVLTHMGNDMDWAWMQANLPDGIEAGHDGMAVHLT